MFDIIAWIDTWIVLWIQEYIRNPILDVFFQCLTRLGDYGSIWLPIIAILVIRKSTRKIGIYMLLGYLLCIVVTDIALKNVVARVRPFHATAEILAITRMPNSFSFPSGHTSLGCSVAFMIYSIVDRKYGKIAIIVALLVALSRVYLGVHYPSDVLGGIVLAMLIASSIKWIYTKGILNPYLDNIVKE